MRHDAAVALLFAGVVAYGGALVWAFFWASHAALQLLAR